ncbi:MAG: FeoB-associated Cys-rich membrane protein [Lachnospiraceae bacterium]|nr:FeoB-associated Cys-rich membrane protein [Lachnospiraceae bacterium]
MLSWIAANIGLIIAVLLLLAVIGIAVLSIVKDKKKGRSACGNNCAHCAMAGTCHQKAAARK